MIRKAILALAATFVLALATIAPASNAEASAYYVINSNRSTIGVRIYNHLGCARYDAWLKPGHDATGHLWQSLWLRPHYQVTEFHRFSFARYTVRNGSNIWHCVRIGQDGFDPAGIRLYVRHL